MLTRDEMGEILADVSFQDYALRVTESSGRIYLQGSYDEPCINTGALMPQWTRKWLLSPSMTRSEIVQTALKLCLTSMEHRTREHFLYRGRRVFGPHFDVDALWALCPDAQDSRQEGA